LGGHHGSLFSNGIANNRLDVLVSTLVWSPMGVPERLSKRVDIELVYELLVSFGIGIWGRHSRVEFGNGNAVEVCGFGSDETRVFWERMKLVQTDCIELHTAIM
jgi:hypothetical protein